MNKYLKLYNFLMEQRIEKKGDTTDVYENFCAWQVAYVAMGIRNGHLHDDTRSFISSPEFVDD